MSRFRGFRLVWWPVLLLLVSGCSTGWSALLGGTGPTDVQGATEGSLDVESNDSVDEAVTITYDSDGNVPSWSGRISTASDIDVYDLGAVQPGDGITVSAKPINGAQTYLLLGLFDDNVDLVDYDPDDADLATGELAVQHIVRHASEHYYLGLAAYGEEGYPAQPGDYQVTLSVTRGGSVPAPQNQTVLLDFDGGTIDMPLDGTFTMGAFDASRVSDQLVGQDALVKQGIKDYMEDVYDGYDIDFYSTEDPMLPSGDYSTVLFGTGYADAGFFGLSETLDHYNQIHTDNAVIVTEVWSDAFEGITTTVDQLITSLGNVAAHELGHMLGLVHVFDVLDIMDNMGGSDALLAEQSIARSKLDTDQMFPFGWQNAPVLLTETLGTP